LVDSVERVLKIAGNFFSASRTICFSRTFLLHIINPYVFRTIKTEMYIFFTIECKGRAGCI